MMRKLAIHGGLGKDSRWLSNIFSEDIVPCGILLAWDLGSLTYLQFHLQVTIRGDEIKVRLSDFFYQ